MINTASFPGVKLSEEARKKLSKTYLDAKNRIMRQVVSHAARHPNSPYSGKGLVTLEKSLKSIYEDLGKRINGDFREDLPKIMKLYYDRAKSELEKIADSVIGEIDQKRIDLALKNTYDTVAGVTTRMAVTHVRELRKIAADVFRQTALTGETRKKVSRMMLNRAMEVPGFRFVDNAGTTWDPRRYFEMLARTELMNAGRDSYQMACEKAGRDVARLTVSGNPCEYCAAYENRLFSLSGVTPGLPSYDDLKAAKVFHPNCTHSFSAVPDYMIKRDFDSSGKPKKGLNS